MFTLLSHLWYPVQSKLYKTDYEGCDKQNVDAALRVMSEESVATAEMLSSEKGRFSDGYAMWAKLVHIDVLFYWSR